MYDWSPQSAGLTNQLGREFFSTPPALSKWLTKNRHLEESKGAEMPKNATTPHTINLPLARPLGYAGCSKFALQCWGFVFATEKVMCLANPTLKSRCRKDRPRGKLIVVGLVGFGARHFLIRPSFEPNCQSYPEQCGCRHGGRKKQGRKGENW